MLSSTRSVRRSLVYSRTTSSFEDINRFLQATNNSRIDQTAGEQVAQMDLSCQNALKDMQHDLYGF